MDERAAAVGEADLADAVGGASERGVVEMREADHADAGVERVREVRGVVAEAVGAFDVEEAADDVGAAGAARQETLEIRPRLDDRERTVRRRGHAVQLAGLVEHARLDVADGAERPQACKREERHRIRPPRIRTLDARDDRELRHDAEHL